MLGLILAAATIGQINVGDYVGYGRTIYVWGEPYCEVEDPDYVESEDSGSYPVYDFTDPGPVGVLSRTLLAGRAGTVVLNIYPVGFSGDYSIDLVLMPNPSTTGNLVTVWGNVKILFFDATTNEAFLEYNFEVLAVFLSPRGEWTWSTPLFGGIPAGTYVTAQFTGSGIGSGPSLWTCPGITTTKTVP